MYDNEYPVRNFLIKLVLVIIFVLLLLWLFPISGFLGGNSQKGDGSAVENRIFGANLNEMKGAAISYFTDERLPQAEGSKVKITLKEMLDKKLLLPLSDHEGKSCNVDKSFVEVSKMKEEYQFKINLKCGKKEEYIITHMGCYTYCKSKLCEKNVAVEEAGSGKVHRPVVKDPITVQKTVVGGPACQLYVKKGTKLEEKWYGSNVEVGFLNKYTTIKGEKITDFGIATSSAPVYNGKTSHTVKADGITKVYGYVKDSRGKTAICNIVIKKDTEKPECEVGVIDGVQDKFGNYIGTVRTKLVKGADFQSGTKKYGITKSSKTTYNMKRTLDISKPGSHTVYGYVKDYAGHTRSCKTSFNIKKTEKPLASKPSCELKITQGTKGDNDWYRSPVRVEFKNKSSTNGAHIKNFGLGNEPTLNGKSYVVAQKDGYYNVKGYVEDSNGYIATCAISFKKDQTKPSCSLAVENGIYNNGGYYTSNVQVGYKNRSDNLSGIAVFGIGKNKNYNMDNSYFITTDGKHTVNGYIKDKAGNENICSINIDKKALSYEYKYYKKISQEYSEWTDWKTYEYDPAKPPKFGKSSTKQVENLGYKKITGYKEEKDKALYRYVPVDYKTSIEKSCDGFDIYRQYTTTHTETTGGTPGHWEVDEVVTTRQNYIVKTVTKTQKSYGVKQTIKNTTTTPTVSGRSGDWKFKGLVTLSYPPTNTLGYRYDFVGQDWSRCSGDCKTTPYSTWYKYERVSSGGTVSNKQDVSIATVTNKIVEEQVYEKSTSGTNELGKHVSTKIISSGSEASYIDRSSSTGPKRIIVKCKMVTKPTRLYINKKELAGFTKKRVPFEKRSYYYRVRTRKLIKPEYIDYKWSHYNDKRLLYLGYIMTNEKRIVG